MPEPAPIFSQAPAASLGGNAIGGLASGWALIHEAGEAIAGLAQLGASDMTIAPGDFAGRAAAAGPAKLRLVGRMIDDCAAALHTGLNALIDAAEAGRDPTAAAVTLWREFDRARTALVETITPPP